MGEYMPLTGVCVLFSLYIFYIIKYSVEVNKKFEDKKVRKEYKAIIANVNRTGLAIYFGITYFCEIRSASHIILSYLLVVGMIIFMRKKYIEMAQYVESNNKSNKRKKKRKKNKKMKRKDIKGTQ